MKPPIKDIPKEDKTSQQRTITLVYTLYIKSPLKEDNLSTKYKTAGPESVFIKRFHCTYVGCSVLEGLSVKYTTNTATSWNSENEVT